MADISGFVCDCCNQEFRTTYEGPVSVPVTIVIGDRVLVKWRDACPDCAYRLNAALPSATAIAGLR